MKKILLPASTLLFFVPVAAYAAYNVTIINTPITDIGAVIVKIVNVLLGFTAALAVLFIIIGGLQYITSAGNTDKAKTGRQTLTYAILGLIIVILSYFIVSLVTNIVNSIFK